MSELSAARDSGRAGLCGTLGVRVWLDLGC